MIRLDKQVALITGSARGVGFEYAKLLFERGAIVVMQDYGVDKDGTGNNPELVQQAAQSISLDPNRIWAVDVNLNNEQHCQNLVDQIVEKFGRVDILIHNAGWVAYQTMEELTQEFLERSMDVNVYIPTWLSKALFPVMKQQKYGRMVFTTSDRAIYKEYGLKGLGPYAIGKMAQIGLMNILAVEGEEYGILVNTVSPVAKTRMWNVEGEPENLKPSQIATGVLYLVSPDCMDSGYILRAANGHFYAVKWTEREGVTYPMDILGSACETPEQIAHAWKDITHSVAF